MIYAISTVLALFIFIFNLFKWPAIFLITIITIYIIIKEIKNKKYSRSIFKKAKEVSEIDYTTMVINELKSYKKIIIDGNNIIAILEKGIFFIKILDYTDKITGDINDEYFYHIIGIKNYKIKNRLKDYYNEYLKYQNKTKEKINKYIVVRNDCSFNLKNLKDTKIISNKYLFYSLDRGTKKYNENQINKIYDELKM